MEKVELTAEENVQPVTVDELERFFGHLEQTLVDIAFLDPERSPPPDDPPAPPLRARFHQQA